MMNLIRSVDANIVSGTGYNAAESNLRNQDGHELPKIWKEASRDTGTARAALIKGDRLNETVYNQVMAQDTSAREKG